jgi:hypothetical protein
MSPTGRATRAVQPVLTGQGQQVGAAPRRLQLAVLLPAECRPALLREGRDSRVAVGPPMQAVLVVADRTGRAMVNRIHCFNDA